MTELNTQAEGFAKSACDLPQFRNFNLAGAKDRIAAILNMIGRVEGIFSTYTRHDISHINTMLSMLDWLVPPTTKRAMTPIDWLLTVLATYLHDLGMVVTSTEYNERFDNPEFVNFIDRIKDDPDAKDYLARADRMNAEEKDRFFYQEFVRHLHASRIREWITGRHNRIWGQTIKPVADEIARIMENLPSRFRENLGLVCESHHRDDLHKTEIYSLCQRYGNDPNEVSNIQYSAILLRTIDLIHVTKDRTPSEMFKLIAFSDLKSVYEWDKQIGTFSVYMKGRRFDPNDTKSHIILVSADFTEERPFFGLTEYLAYADRQIVQNKQWADKSQQLPDAKDYSFPWRSIKGDIRVEGNQPQQMRFELDRGRLLDLLVGHTIYNEPTVAVRELLQNAIDAVRFQYFLEQKKDGKSEPQMGRVLIKWNPSERELIVEDNGIGMDLDIIENHLLRVGSSFYDTPQFQTDNAEFTPISRFGIGVLTCFMVSDDIEIITFRSQEGRRIKMTSVHADYLLKNLAPGHPELDGLEPHGTRVKLRIRPSVDLKKQSLVEIVRQWVILPLCDVIYSEKGAEEKIGFTDITEAMRSLYFKKLGVDLDETLAETIDDTYEIIRMELDIEDKAMYELAFIVRRGYTPERSFTNYRGEASAAVCIEGIRADWALPGFSNRLPAILSVRNNRRFRTTVSRASLEQDDEYIKVANACAKTLFNHVKGEVERISNQIGRPLSQASTAGRWVYNDLMASATGSVINCLKELYQEMPLIVLERSRGTQAGTSASRELNSLKEVASLDSFWTIESRTVDYLGTISRDLGRELSITDFLGTLAPELLDSRISPVIPDAKMFLDFLQQTHSVDRVEFSRRNQRTLLRFARDNSIYSNQVAQKGQKELELAIQSVSTRLGLERFVDRPMSAYGYKKVMGEVINYIYAAEISGDIEDVIGVSTRLVTVLSKHKHCGIIWDKLNSVWNTMQLSGGRVEDKAIIFAAMFILASAALSRGVSIHRGARLSSGEAHYWNAPWHSLLDDLEKLLSKANIKLEIPDAVDSLLGTRKQWFDASSFWWDWSSTERRRF